MKRILLTSAVALIASAANAADMYSTKDAPAYNAPAPSWTGFIIGTDVSFQGVNHEVKLNEYNVNLLDLNGLSGVGPGGGVLVEYRYQFGSRFVFGIGGEYLFTSAPVNLNIYPGTSTSLEMTDGWDVYATGGIIINQWALAYVGGGYGQRSFRTAGILSTIGVGDFTADGAIIKAGLEAKLAFLSPNWLVRAEYEHFFANQNTLWSEGDSEFNASITDVASVNSVKAVLAYQFGGDYAPLK